MRMNVGNIDRMMRAMVGVILLAAPFVSGLALFDSAAAVAVFVLVGLVMLVVAATRVCPLYSVFGFKTCKN